MLASQLSAARLRLQRAGVQARTRVAAARAAADKTLVELEAAAAVEAAAIKDAEELMPQV